MSHQRHVGKSHDGLLPADVEGFDSLAELALDMRWSWDHVTDEVWRRLDPVLWDLTPHPWDVLQTVSREKIKKVLADPAWDAAEAVTLYERLEREVIPEFYARNDQGIPTAWVARMRESMALLTPRFSANRAVREYAEKHDLPAAAAYRKRAAGKGAAGRQIASCLRKLSQAWPTLRFGETQVETRGEQHIITVQVYLGGLDPEAVRVELYADGVNGGAPVRQEMQRVRQLVGASNRHVYSTAVSATRPAADFTARVIPFCQATAVPLEAAWILWQR